MAAQRSDAELIADVLTGNSDAYSALVKRYQDAYVRFAVRMLGNRDDADDALQSAFVRAFRALGSCKDPARFAAWLYQIVINECRTLVSRRALRERRFVRDEAELRQQPAVSVVGHVGELDEIQRALDRIDPEQREAFVLKHVEELSYDEMSALTGANVSALKMRVKRACERLRVLLDPARSYS